MSDFGKRHAARIAAKLRELRCASNLAEAGFVRLDRNEEDDPVILETWL